MSNDIATAALRRDPYVITPDQGGNLIDLSSIVVPHIDGFYCCLFELPLLGGTTGAISKVIDDISQWYFVGSIQQITLPVIIYDNPIEWRGYNDNTYVFTYKFNYDHTLEIVLIDDEFSFTLNLLTTWHSLLPGCKLTQQKLYRPIKPADNKSGISFEEIDRSKLVGPYKGNILILSFTPTIELVYAVLVLNAFPQVVPLNSMQLDVSNYTFRTLNVTFLFDKLLYGPPLLHAIEKEGNIKQQVMSLLRVKAETTLRKIGKSVGGELGVFELPSEKRSFLEEPSSIRE